MKKMKSAVALGLLLLLTAMIVKTRASFASGADTEQNADVAGYGMQLDVSGQKGSITQNESWDSGKIISIDNRSHTALAYDIAVSVENHDSWPDGLTVVLLTGDEEKTDGVISGGVCTFSDSDWCLAPGEKAENVYGLKLGTSYETPPGDYMFRISSVTYQVDR